MDFGLQVFQESGGLATIHLRMMKLERDGERGLEPAAPVSAPGEEGVVVDAAVLVDDAVEFGAHHRRCSDECGALVVDGLAGGGRLLRNPVVVAAELLQVGAVGHVAVGDAALGGVYNHIDGQAVELVELPLFRQQIALFDAACGPADAPAQEHVEFHALPPTYLSEPRHVEGLEERHHGHGRLHPHREGLRPGGLLGGYFLFHPLQFLPPLGFSESPLVRNVVLGHKDTTLFGIIVFLFTSFIALCVEEDIGGLLSGRKEKSFLS